MPAARSFTVATFNLYNLNLPGRRMYAGTKPWTEDEYRRKIAFVAQQLREAQADIVGLQELWHADAMREAMREAGMDTTHELLAPADATGGRIVCAAIVRTGLRVGEPAWASDFHPDFVLESRGDDAQTAPIAVGVRAFSRPVLRFEVALHPNDAPARVFVCHFKSKRPTRIDAEDWFKARPDTYRDHREALGAAISTIRRTAESAALRFALTLEMKRTDAPVIVIGDVNDGQHSNTVNVLTEQPRYLTGIATGGADNALYTAQTLQEYRDTRDVYYTHIHLDLRESLDHILVSEQFYDHSKKRLWLFDGLAINNDHLNVEDHRAHGSGDHGIVRVRFVHRPAKG